jgi:hypothetical protein
VVQVHRASVVAVEAGLEPGTLAGERGGLVVACGEGGLSLDLVQPSGGRPMGGEAFRAGRRGLPGRLELDGEPMPPLVVEVSGQNAKAGKGGRGES